MSVRNAPRENRMDSGTITDTSGSTIVQLSGTFHFLNGDVYKGMFELRKDKQKVVRQGNGVYKTADGQIYEGVWENDFITGNCKITFLDKSVFSGTLIGMMIEGHGKYTFVENVQIGGEFFRNRLIGGVYLEDPNGRVWKGTVAKDGSIVTFRQHNIFWQAVKNMTSGDDHSLDEEDMEESENPSIY